MKKRFRSPNTIYLNLIAEDFADTYYGSSGNCFIAKAIKRTFNIQYVSVGVHGLTINKTKYIINNQMGRCITLLELKKIMENNSYIGLAFTIKLVKE